MADRALALGLLVVWAGCAAPRADLRTGADALSASWTRISAADTSVALHHTSGGTIAASVACDAVDEDAPLDVLVNHVLMQIEKPIERGRHETVLDGRGALRARVGARLDGVPVEIELIVLKKDGCVVDAQLIAGAGSVEARRADFDRFVAGLSVSRRRR
jgi:hypothetical protein